MQRKEKKHLVICSSKERFILDLLKKGYLKKQISTSPMSAMQKEANAVFL